jgi:hypothetical protein
LLLQEQRNEGVQNPKKPVQEGDTRWNSTHYMLERFVLLYRFIVAVKDKYDIRELKAKLPDNPHMSEELVDVSKIYSEFLKPFKVLSEGCQSSSVPTLPLVAQHMLPIVLGGEASLLKQDSGDSRLVASVKKEMKA